MAREAGLLSLATEISGIADLLFYKNKIAKLLELNFCSKNSKNSPHHKYSTFVGLALTDQFTSPASHDHVLSREYVNVCILSCVVLFFDG